MPPPVNPSRDPMNLPLAEQGVQLREWLTRKPQHSAIPREQGIGEFLNQMALGYPEKAYYGAVDALPKLNTELNKRLNSGRPNSPESYMVMGATMGPPTLIRPGGEGAESGRIPPSHRESVNIIMRRLEKDKRRRNGETEPQMSLGSPSGVEPVQDEEGSELQMSPGSPSGIPAPPQMDPSIEAELAGRSQLYRADNGMEPLPQQAQPPQTVNPSNPSVVSNNPMSDQWLAEEYQRQWNEAYGSNMGQEDQTNWAIKKHGYENPAEGVQASAMTPLLQLMQNRQAKLEERHPVRNFFDAFGDALPNDNTALGGFGRGYRSARDIREGREKKVDANDDQMAKLQSLLAERQGMADRSRGTADLINPEEIGKSSDLTQRLRMIQEAMRVNAYGQGRHGYKSPREGRFIDEYGTKFQEAHDKLVNGVESATTVEEYQAALDKLKRFRQTYSVAGELADYPAPTASGGGNAAGGGDHGLIGQGIDWVSDWWNSTGTAEEDTR